MKLLVSVRDVDEALTAAEAGADFIDLKEPRAGALGALPLDTIREVVAALRRLHPACRISATVGDFAPDAWVAVLERVRLTAGCGVDDVKVGIARGGQALLDALAASLNAVQARIVPVFLADEGLDAPLITRAHGMGFAALMLDTAHKARGSLFEVVSHDALADFVQRTRASGQLGGVAGALRMTDVPALLRLAPDFAGFRSAVCDGARTGSLQGQRVSELRQQLTSGHPSLVLAV